MAAGASTETTATVRRLYRYPVKGLSPEALASVDLEEGQNFPLDRVFALALAATAFDEAAPRPLPKKRFLVLAEHERLARLATRYDPGTDELTVRHGECSVTGRVATAEGRAAIDDFFESYAGAEAGGRPRLVRGSEDGHRFTDASVVSPELMRAVSVVNLASVRDLEARTGAALDPLRFRANVYVDGLEPWSELDWVERDVSLGPVPVRGLLRTRRCPATEVNPATAERDVDVPARLREHLGHADCGVYVAVRAPGRLSVGDAVTW